MQPSDAGLTLYLITLFGAGISCAGGVLLCVFSWRAAAVRWRERTHEVAVLQILACIGLSDAVFTTGWLAAFITGTGMPQSLRGMQMLHLSVSPVACSTINATLTLSLLAQSTWAAVLAWYLAQALIQVRPPDDWWLRRYRVHAAAWILPIACSFLIYGVIEDVCFEDGDGLNGTNTSAGNMSSIDLTVGNLSSTHLAVAAPDGTDPAADDPDATDAFIVLVLIVPLGALVYTLYTYVRIMLSFRFCALTAEVRYSHVNKMEFRLTSYLAAFLVCQVCSMAYHLCSLLPWNADPVPFSAPLFYEESQGWLLWAWYLTQPMQGLVDALVYLHHARNAQRTLPGHYDRPGCCCPCWRRCWQRCFGRHSWMSTTGGLDTRLTGDDRLITVVAP